MGVSTSSTSIPTKMDRQTQIDKAQTLRRMHDRTAILLLPNAWDAGSARLFAQRGFAAIATTSAGVACSPSA